MRRVVSLGVLLLGVSQAAQSQTRSIQPAPGEQKSHNIQLIAHIPMGGPFYSNDVEFEQEASRPYVYVSGRSHYGFKVVSTKNLQAVSEIYRWTINNPELHDGRA